MTSTKEILDEHKARRARTHADTNPAPVTMAQLNGLATSTNISLESAERAIGRLKIVIALGFAAQVLLVVTLFALALWHHQVDVSRLEASRVCH